MKETHKLKGKKTDKNGKQIPTTHHRDFIKITSSLSDSGVV